ncbi:MAG: HesA/MoeB/ThiF family protein [Aliarcobacter cryaerophilus]|nr:HesA/MoeB/ThiF family protein [Aliarcobacter cryaerophilus]
MSEISKQTRLSQEEINRYSRHLILPEVGLKGQLKLKNSKVLVVGTGALGSPVLLYLSAAGIGTIGIIDFDTVDESNLQRQIIHSTNEIGNPKVNSAKSRINSINPNIDVIAYNDKLTSKNALEIIKNFDVVVDGTDNFQTRYLINDACVFLNKTFLFMEQFLDLKDNQRFLMQIKIVLAIDVFFLNLQKLDLFHLAQKLEF